jgi:peptide-methionine (R)-S-oxide reductase
MGKLVNYTLKINAMSKFNTLITLALFLFCSCSNNAQNQSPMSPKPADKNPANLSEEEWKNKLSPQQYYILREKGTEMPHSGKYNMHFDEGTYTCAGCGTELFKSDMKFDSHCGWPSFDREIAGGKIKKIKDTSHGMIRIEIICANCGGHLGHLFDDGPTATGQRYCVNSLSLDFKKAE